MHILALGGPTATGKTALAAAAAHALGVDVISADSRQVYRGLDLGTGKDLDEFRRFHPPVAYHLIDIVEPEQVHSLFQYQDACYRVIEDLAQSPGPRGRLAILVGGTGLYMEAILRRYRIANVPEDIAFRESLAARDQEELVRELERLDPALAARTDKSSKKRIIRALEVAAWGAHHPVEYSRPPAEDFTCTVFVTTGERSALRESINRRLEARLKAGMVEEVEGLIKRGLSRERFQVLGMEYREIAAYLMGEKSREVMVEDLRHEIHLLAKRQETWFRGLERRGIPVRWIEAGEGPEALIQAGKERL